jgi:hypothetical protein
VYRRSSIALRSAPRVFMALCGVALAQTNALRNLALNLLRQAGGTTRLA